MSRVTNAILTAFVGPQGSADLEIESVNRTLRMDEGGGFGEFKEVSDYAGGSKMMECRVYLSAFNHAHTETIIRAVDEAPWRDKRRVQLFLREQEEEIFLLRYAGRQPQTLTTPVALTKDELMILSNALHEFCSGRYAEFEIRYSHGHRGSTTTGAPEED